MDFKKLGLFVFIFFIFINIGFSADNFIDFDLSNFGISSTTLNGEAVSMAGPFLFLDVNGSVIGETNFYFKLNDFPLQRDITYNNVNVGDMFYNESARLFYLNVRTEFTNDECVLSQISEEFVCQMKFQVIEGSVIKGTLDVYMSISSDSLKVANKPYRIVKKSSNMNIGDIDFDFTSLLDSVENILVSGPVIREDYRFTVKDMDGNLIPFAELMVEVNDEFDIYLISKGIVENNQIVSVLGSAGDEVFFYIDGVNVDSRNIVASDFYEIELETNYILNNTGFKDSDLDGVSDDFDKCPNSSDFYVDKNGCGCSQKVCTNSMCILDNINRPVCQETCFDDFQNQNEEGIDCGGICGISCNSKSLNVNENPNIKDCRVDGCSGSFICDNSDGLCKQQVQTKRKSCKTEEFEVHNTRVNCKEVHGEEWIEDYHGQYISYSVNGPPLIEDFVEDEVASVFNQITLCVKTQEFEKVPIDLSCPWESSITPENIQFAEREILNYINGLVSGAEDALGSFKKIAFVLSGLILDVDINFNVHLSSFTFNVSENQTGSHEIIEGVDSCKELIKNGDSTNKLDLLFIGDYPFEDEFIKDVKKIVDYETNNLETVNEGLFSVEPFKSNKEKFNIWYMNKYESVNYFFDETYGEFQADYSDLYELKLNCPQSDYNVFLSINNFRSNCQLGKDKFCRITYGDNYKGRLVLHELGHGIGELGDEYINYINERDNSQESEIDIFDFSTKNCKKSQSEAQQEWGNLVNSNFPEMNYFNGCGGDCEEGNCPLENNIRPTFNGVMKNQRLNCDTTTQNCEFGPPFNEFSEFSKREIQSVLDEYS